MLGGILFQMPIHRTFLRTSFYENFIMHTRVVIDRVSYGVFEGTKCGSWVELIFEKKR
jgi:hypothetical protein